MLFCGTSRATGVWSGVRSCRSTASAGRSPFCRTGRGARPCPAFPTSGISPGSTASARSPADSSRTSGRRPSSHASRRPSSPATTTGAGTPTSISRTRRPPDGRPCPGTSSPSTTGRQTVAGVLGGTVRARRAVGLRPSASTFTATGRTSPSSTRVTSRTTGAVSGASATVASSTGARPTTITGDSVSRRRFTTPTGGDARPGRRRFSWSGRGGVSPVVRGRPGGGCPSRASSGGPCLSSGSGVAVGGIVFVGACRAGGATNAISLGGLCPCPTPTAGRGIFTGNGVTFPCPSRPGPTSIGL